MSDDRCQPRGPEGGLQLQRNSVRRWHWSPAGELLSSPVRCRREQWYLARGFLANGAIQDSADVLLSFMRDDDDIVAEHCVRLCPLSEAKRGEGLLGWIQAPEDATHLRVRLPESSNARQLDRLVLHPVAERDAKCHPLANVPRWSCYRSPFPIERVVLPASLEMLADGPAGSRIDPVRSPRSVRELAGWAAGAACVVDPAWVRDLGLTLADLERIAARSWVIVDLETFATLLSDGPSAVRTKTVSHTADHDIMSARVEYADLATRGFALQDVFPYSTLAGETAFGTRVLLANRDWKRYAGEIGFATLLSSETPWEDKCGDVLSAARPVDRGELIITDLAWLVAGQHGRLLAPRLAEHLLRMHLGGPVADCVQYWNRWDDCQVMVRDIADLVRHFPMLRTARWASEEPGVARLGITVLGDAARRPARHLMICTRRIDQRSSHDGVPPEPMTIFVKWLARETREQTRWAKRYLDDTAVTWQFSTAGGVKYALQFESATGAIADKPASTLILRTGDPRDRGKAACSGDATVQTFTVPADAGVLGDGSIAYQADLTHRLRRWIEQVGT